VLGEGGSGGAHGGGGGGMADGCDEDGLGPGVAGSKRAASGGDEPSGKRHAAAHGSASKPKATAAGRKGGGSGGGGGDGDDEGGQRVSWSSEEDQIIVRAVQELGPRWCAVAARLPARTDQAVRNRWNRLQQRARVQARTMLSAYQTKYLPSGAPRGVDVPALHMRANAAMNAAD
jgi:hypothetical protein